MSLLFGMGVYQTVVNVFAFTCALCGTLAGQHVIKRSTKFTLIFLPSFPVSTAYLNTCTHCGGSTRLTTDQARHSMERARTHPQA